MGRNLNPKLGKVTGMRISGMLGVLKECTRWGNKGENAANKLIPNRVSSK
ncbi:hypothetical protein RintRC_4423 [Richelia intracellularis]|nr:hypothetical protein RintRC_4423 [Richelia intracellularis]